MRVLFRNSRVTEYFSVPSLPLALDQHITAGEPEGTIIIAKQSNDGSLPLGGLWFSFFLEPVVRKDELPLIPLMTAVAIANTLTRITGVSPMIKWPTDVVIDYKRVADIKCQVEYADHEKVQIARAKITVGINTNVPMHHIPESAHETITSTFHETGEGHSNTSVLNRFCHEFEQLYNKINREERRAILQEYCNLLTTLNKEVIVTSNDKEESGRAIAIDEDGSLLFRTDDGVIKKVYSADVLFG